MLGGEARRILVVVKTYPNPSRSYIETVCCAGVDLDTRTWVRMYPITYRRLADKKFPKYQVISCEVSKPRDDTRPESLRVHQDTIELIDDPMPSGDSGWRKRMALLPPPARSLEEIQAAQHRIGTSLGMFRPKEIKRLVKRKAKPWGPRQLAALRQQRLGLGEAETAELAELEQIPWSFAYEFTCDDDRCKGHELGILDWEIGESYRRWFRQYGDRREEKLRAKYEVERRVAAGAAGGRLRERGDEGEADSDALQGRRLASRSVGVNVPSGSFGPSSISLTSAAVLRQPDRHTARTPFRTG